MINNYLLSEKDSDLVFAVIKDIDTALIGEGYIDLINKVGQAIEDEYCYEERIKLIHGSIEYKENSHIFYISFKCLDDIEEEEIREVELNQVAIY